MTEIIKTEVTMTFIRGGISKNDNPYLQVSNGRKEFFVNMPKDLIISGDEFDSFQENDEITFNAKILPGSDSITFVSLA